jgi:NADP-dependent 3-hydroxy acid dehydrogenase YdfG
MGQLEGKIAWITGAGSGIGAAAAQALANAGAKLVLSGRRRESLEAVAAEIPGASIEAGDLADPATAPRIAAAIAARFGRLDILVNNAGLNVLRRAWAELSAAGADEVFGANLHAAFYCVIAALPMMRAQKDGLLIHTASFAGRFVSLLSGPAYSAAKHAVVAMSHSLNMEECVNGIRSTVICPGEVATPILDRRPVPVSAEDRARMLRPEDCADLIRYVACLPASVCLNEVLITPTWNRGYVAARARAMG